MTVLPTGLDTNSLEYEANRAALLGKLTELEAEHAKALAGGGEKYVARHRGAASSRRGSGSSCSWTPTPRSWSCRPWPPGAAITRSAPRSSRASGWWRASSA